MPDYPESNALASAVTNLLLQRHPETIVEQHPSSPDYHGAIVSFRSHLATAAPIGLLVDRDRAFSLHSGSRVIVDEEPTEGTDLERAAQIFDKIVKITEHGIATSWVGRLLRSRWDPVGPWREVPPDTDRRSRVLTGGR